MAKKLARRAEAGAAVQAKVAEKKEGDDINWFGEKVGAAHTIIGSSAATGAVGKGVGKYLNAAKRPLEGASALSSGNGVGEPGQKKRKTGFGEFEGW